MYELLRLKAVIGIAFICSISSIALATTARFTTHIFSEGDETHVTVQDHQILLEWQREGSADKQAWPAALAYCDLLEFGGYDDWRLPNVLELSSIIDESKTTVPAINTSFFSDDFNTDDYWTSTTHPRISTNAYAVTFYDSGGTEGRGGVKNEAKTGSKKVICVRTLP